MTNEAEIAKKRSVKLFEFVQEIARRRSPVKRSLREYDWIMQLGDLPEHPGVRLGFREGSAPGDDDDVGVSYAIRVERPEETEAPQLPESLDPWVIPGWHTPEGSPQTLEARNFHDDEGGTQTIKFDDDEDRVSLYREWLGAWLAWSKAEKPTRRVIQVYERLFELRGRLKRESERVQLVLGDGLLAVSDVQGLVEHPTLLQRVELHFDARERVFEVVIADEPPQVNVELLRNIESVDSAQLARIRDRLNDRHIGIQDLAATREFLTEMVHGLFSNGKFEPLRPSPLPDRPVIWQSQSLFVAPRTLQLQNAVSGFLERLKEMDIPPPSISRVVGAEVSVSGPPVHESGAEADHPYEPRDIDLFLTKPANGRQEEALRHLARQGFVCVQGPPGTGKTHTIANMVGHLLAEGQRVLITSHTPKALRVVRRAIVEDLRNLCVSVLESDTDSRQELEESVNGITSRLSTEDERELAERARASSLRREGLKTQLSNLERKLNKAIRTEYDDIIVGGESCSPSDAARRLREWTGVHDWIPGPVTPSAPLPLSHEEILEVYRLSGRVREEDEIALGGSVPNLDMLMSPSSFREQIRTLDELASTDPNIDADLCTGEWSTDPNKIKECQHRIERAMETLKRYVKQIPECVDAGRSGGNRLTFWNTLISEIESTRESIEAHEIAAVTSAVTVSLDWTLDDQLETCQAIMIFLEKGRFVGRKLARTWPKWKAFLESTTVFGRSPETIADLAAIESFLRARHERRHLTIRWNAARDQFKRVPELGGGDKPETVATQHIATIRKALDWHDEHWQPALEALREIGICWDGVYSQTPPNPNEYGELQRIYDAAKLVRNTIIPFLLEAHTRETIEKRLHEAKTMLLAAVAADTTTRTRGLIQAIEERNPTAYEDAHSAVVEILQRHQDAVRRSELLERVQTTAPGLHDELVQRRPPHDRTRPPGDDPASAWLYRQYLEELDRRSQLDSAALQNQLRQTSEELRNETSRYVDAKAWQGQIKRIGLKEQQALNGWLQTVNTRGYQSGIRSAQLKAQARHLLGQARDAVPVWVMPISRAIESLDFKTAEFDVVIIDEASQCDVMGLLMMGIAKKVIVVGDDKQVSPVAVGEELAYTQKLIAEYLEDLPAKELFTGRQSIYDMATRAFGQPIRLTEHFRCAEDIIEFSSTLSYDGKIEPLREVSEVETRPFCVGHRVRDGERKSYVNRAEALEIASLMIACSEMPEYEGKTFGVISMVKEQQSREIDSILQRRMSTVEYERRDVLCGTPAQFQGDERDIMFISLVDHGQGTPLRRVTNDDAKKRYNVAASRAKDQMWIVHSLSLQTELQADDLRARLIRHAQDPNAAARAHRKERARTESPFELDVLQRLQNAGYRIRSQWPVGSLRIDMVAFGSEGRRIAIECDGDRWHSADQQDKDLQRQMLLERLGWRFIRIRGSTWFRDPDTAFERLKEDLRRIGIEPIGEEIDSSQRSGDDVKERAIRRAFEIREEWRREEEEDVDLHGGTREVPESNEQASSDEQRAELLDAVRSAGHGLTRDEILERTSIDPAVVSSAAASLVESGQLVREGAGISTRYLAVEPESSDGLDSDPFLLSEGLESDFPTS